MAIIRSVSTRRRSVCDGHERTLKTLAVLWPVSADATTIGAHVSCGRDSRTYSFIFFHDELSLSSTASHLLQMITHPLPSSTTRSAIFPSWSDMSSVPSTSSRETSDLRIALNALLIMKNSVPNSIPRFLLIPAVSISRYSFPSFSTISSTLSLVVPGMLLTIALSLCTNLLSKVDFPTFGFPIIETLMAVSSTGSTTFGRLKQTSSNRSPVPVP
mmetsp:Transcript_7051/g.31077  ORF Transcript_7051/g.31077 Transcript_7051/m.31077 type:complete len:215 (+) Transcript_7051:4112-4756(+)